MGQHFDDLALRVPEFSLLAPAHKLYLAEIDAVEGGITSGHLGLRGPDGARRYLLAMDNCNPPVVLDVELPLDPDKPVTILALYGDDGWRVESNFRTHD